MKTITVVTPSNIEVEYRLAGAGSRIAAFIVDFTLQYLIVILFALVVLLGIDYRILGNSPPSGVALGLVLVFWFVMNFGYFIVSEMVLNGQSVGKKIFSLRVIRDNGMPLGFGQSLVRGLLRTSVDMLYVGFFAVLFSKQHKRLGDMAAGTIVISEHREEFVSYTSQNLPDFLPNPHSHTLHWPDFLPDPFSLTQDERRLAEEWLARRDDMPDGGKACGDKLLAYLTPEIQATPLPDPM
ncbi:MAG: RDD family protein [Defluviitaleaceae bacterium]|nr:RDD family protein [Defluviitaleaceae bacterium]